MAQLQCSAILFDLDGVLVDSTQSVIVAWTEWAMRNGIQPEEVVKTIHGRRTAEVLESFTPQADIASEARKVEEFVTMRKEGIVPVPGAAKLLHELPQDRWCVVTSGIGSLARMRLHAAGLPVPHVLVAAEDVRNGKPHPEPYLKGAKLLGFDPKECVVIEDALAGIRAGRAGGMKVIGLATTYPAEQLSEADFVLNTLEGIALGFSNGVLDLTL